MPKIFFLLFISTCLLFSCGTDPSEPIDPNPVETRYFPPLQSEDWQKLSPDSLGWDSGELSELYDFLQSNKSRAFIVLKDGKIVAEKYWGNNITNTTAFGQNSLWYWASAGKTLTAFLVGLAQQQGLLSIEDKSSDYLGKNWSSLPPEKEELIKIYHQLSMTTGLDYEVQDVDCTQPGCLLYKAEAGSQWFYHNAPYTLLERVVSEASGKSYNQYTDEELEEKIGMNGSWISAGFNNVYWSKPRDAARFGWLILNEGRWGNQTIMTDSSYFQAMINSSQELNPSYGYLWWLNGKGSIILPGLSNKFSLSLSPNAPDELIAAMGKNGQFIDLLPSQGIVVVRMGEAPDGSAASITFHDEMWKRLSTILHD